MTRIERIAALGSSFAAGPGIDPVADPVAARSERNYPHQLARRLGAQLTDLTISGATIATILDSPQEMMTGTSFPPQIEGLPADAQLVTLTAGGNDLQFAGSMLFAALNRTAPQSPITEMLAPTFAHGIPEPTESATEAMAAGLERIVDEVRARTDHARVILVDYLTVLDASPSTDLPFDADELDILLRIQTAVAAGYRLAAETSGAELLNASTLSADHGLGSDDPWVFGFDPTPEGISSSFHPNLRGMTAIAAELARLVET